MGSEMCIRDSTLARAYGVRLVGGNLQKRQEQIFVSEKALACMQEGGKVGERAPGKKPKSWDAKKKKDNKYAPSTTKPCWPFMGGSTYVRFRCPGPLRLGSIPLGYE